jgi:predicted PurR-regulated permease PerM
MPEGPSPAPHADADAAATKPSGAEPRRSLADALTAIERATTSFKIVPVLLGIGLLWWGQAVFIPVVMSVLVSYALEPPVARFEKWGLPRWLGVPLVLLVLVAGITAAVYPLRGQAIAFANRLPDAAHKLVVAFNRGGTSAFLKPVVSLRQAATEIERATAPGAPARRPGDAAPVRIEEPPIKVNDWLMQGSHGVLELGGQLFAIVCLSYYLLVVGDKYKRKVVHIVGPSMSSKKTTVQILDEIDRQIARFLWARALISGVVAVAMWVAFRLLGVEEPGIWALLSALLFPIPVVGHVVVTLTVIVAAFLQFESLGMAVLVGSVTGVIAGVEGNVLTPWLMSRVGDMNAAAVFVSLMFWGWLWGIWGLVLAVPMTAAVKVLCERVDELNPIAELLGQ